MPGDGRKNSPKRGKKNSVALTPTSDWLAWLATVPTEDRVSLANQIRALKEPTFETIGDLASEAMASILEGKISPDISRELRAWTELKMATVAASTATRTPGSQVTLVGLLTETDFDVPKLEPAYTRKEKVLEGEVLEDDSTLKALELKA